MGLGGVEWLLSDRRSTNGAYSQILTTCIFGAFGRVVTNVGNNDGSVRSIIPDVGSDGVGVHYIVLNGRNGHISVDCEFLLETEN